MTETQPEPSILDQFQITKPRLVEKTALAVIWKVECQNGNYAALKIYHGSDMRNEGAGFDLLREWNGYGAALLLGRTNNIALIEWLDGPSLGDLTRSNEDEKANTILVEVANKLHSNPISRNIDLPLLADWFKELLHLETGANCPASACRNINKAQVLARDLLASQQNIVPLHGDLHHDNVLLGARGYCAFDAKGVLGERTYELANAFRNPKGADGIVKNPHRIETLANQWSKKFNVDRHRLLQWAAAKCALSIAWRNKGVVEHDREFGLLSLLIHIASMDE